MTDTLAIALAQLNPTVGDLEGNKALILRARDEAAAQGVDLVVCTELAITGYPPEDLVLKPMFQAETRAAVEALAAATADGGPALLLGTPWLDDGKLYNAALLLDGGEIAARRYKYELPNYGVFDEVRVFARAGLPGPIPFRGVRLGVMICEDMWFPEVAECLDGIGRRDHNCDQRLALRERQGRRSSQPRRRPHRRDRVAAHLRESSGRPGRARLRRRLLRAQRRPRPLCPGTRL